MARRGAGVQRLPPPGFIGLVVALRDNPRRCRQGLGHFVRGGPRALGKAADQRSADFRVPLIDKGVPQPFPVLLAEPSDLFQHSVGQPVGISGGTPGWLGSRRGCDAHVRRSAVLDRGNRGGLLLCRQGGERIELSPVIGDLRHDAKCLAHRRSDAVDPVNRAPRIRSRDAELASGGTNAAFATASALSGGLHRLRSFIQRGNWPNLAQFVTGLIAALTLAPLAPQPDP